MLIFIKPISNSKKTHLITFIDDFSRKAWIYFLIEKSEAFSVLIFLKIHVEKEANSFIRGLRTDRGGQFTIRKFTIFYSENGIQRKLTTAYTPQQNMVAEQKNISIMNMLSEKRIEFQR